MQPPANSTQQNIAKINHLHSVMANIISRHSAQSGDFLTPIPNLLFFRRDAPTVPMPCLVEPSVVLVVQGVKQMLVGDVAYPYDTNHFLITSLDLPATSQVITANKDNPCLGLVLKLDMRIIADLITQTGTSPPPQSRLNSKSIGIGNITPALLEPFSRLLTLLADPNAASVLAPLVQREIHYRLLMSDQAMQLWQIASIGSQSHRVAKAIDWLKMNYALPLRIENLANLVQMSTSSLHQHFRQLTAMSPLQYQKWLRLNEAKRLMLNEHLDVATAAFRVGYESPSQFSREYGRLFGSSPKRDIKVS